MFSLSREHLFKPPTLNLFLPLILLEDSLQGAFKPCLRCITDEVSGQPAVTVEEIRGGQADNVVLLGRLVTDADEVRNAVIRDELLYVLLICLRGNTNNDQPTLSVLLVDFNKARSLQTAWAAPWRPEVHSNDFSLEI